MKVSVTLRDIAKGIPHSPRNCPIALAVRRGAPHPARGRQPVYVSEDLIQVGDRGWEPDGRIRAFMRAFDCGVLPGPFSFNMEDPA